MEEHIITNPPRKLSIGDQTGKEVSVRAVGSSVPMDVAIIDSSGNQISTFGGGTQYTEGDTDASITGTAMMMEGAGDALVPAQGTTADGLLVNLGTNNDVTVTAVTPGTAAGNLGKAEDAAHASGDTGVMALAVRNDSASTVLTGTNGDYSPISVNSIGAVFTVEGKAEDAAHSSGDRGNFILGLRNDSNATRTSTDSDYSPISVDLAGNLTAVGNLAHDAVDSGNPIKIGAQATDYEPDTEDAQGRADVAAADRVDIATNLKGEQIDGVNSMFHYFDGTFPDTGLDGVYDDNPTSSTSEAVECWNYRYATVGLCIDSTLAPTDIRIDVEVSPDNTIWYKLMNGPLGLWIYEDTGTATEICRALNFEISSRFIRVKITCTGTDATNFFTVDDSYIYLHN